MYKNITLAIDINNNGDTSSVMPKIINLLYAFNSNLHIVNIIPNYSVFRPIEGILNKEWYNNYRLKIISKIKNLIKTYLPVNIDTYIYVERGRIYEEVISYSLKNKVSLIILLCPNKEAEMSLNIKQILKYSPIDTLILKY